MGATQTARTYRFQHQQLTLDQIAALPDTVCRRDLLAWRIRNGWAPEDAAAVPSERQPGTPFHPRAVPYLGENVAFTFRGESWGWADFAESDFCEVTLGTLRKRVTSGIDPERARLSLKLEQERKRASELAQDRELIVSFLRSFGDHIAKAPKVVRHVLLDRAKQKGLSTKEGNALIEKLLDADQDNLRKIYEELGLIARPDDPTPREPTPSPKPEPAGGGDGGDGSGDGGVDNGIPPEPIPTEPLPGITVEPLDPARPITEDDLKDPPLEDVLGEAAAAAKALGDDLEGVAFLLGHYQAELVQRACSGQLQAIREQCQQQTDDSFLQRLYATTRTLLEAAEALPIPVGYGFKHQPSLVQRIVALRAGELRSLLILLDVGLGKTLSAVLATRHADSRCTVVIAPSDQKAREWGEEILGTAQKPGYFPGAIVKHRFDESLDKGFAGRWNGTTPLFLIFTVDDLRTNNKQQRRWAELMALYSPDAVIFDEVHLLKATFSDEEDDEKTTSALTQRRQVAKQLVRSIRQLDPRALVLGLTGTAVLNELREGRSLVELVCDTEELPEIAGPRDLPSATRLYQAFTRNGVRLSNPSKNHDIERKTLDCSHLLMPLVRLKRSKANVAQVANLVVQEKVGPIFDWIQDGEGPAVIYSHYVSGIVGDLVREGRSRGLRVGVFTGDSKVGTEGGESSLDDFKAGALDVLVLSSAGGTGIDGLQSISNRIAVAAMPWTWAALMQLIGRLDRMGQPNRVEVFIPEVAVTTPMGRTYSWCDWVWRKLLSKRTLSLASMDGLLPTTTVEPAEAETSAAFDAWIERILSEGLSLLRREPLKIPPFATAAEAEQMRRRAGYSCFSRMNNLLNRTVSSKTHQQFKGDPLPWQLYQADLEEYRKDWAVDPLTVMVEELLATSEALTIGDFGCGQAQIARAVGHLHSVHSFDHVAIDEELVTPCNIAEGTGLLRGSLDVAVFSLSLMCSDWEQMLVEAHRCLRYSGSLRVWEATSRWASKPGELEAGIEKAGFRIAQRETRGSFTHIWAVRR